MSTRQTEIVDIESLDAGAVVLLGELREEWRIVGSDPIDDAEEWLLVELAPLSIHKHGTRRQRLNRIAQIEVICA